MRRRVYKIGNVCRMIGEKHLPTPVPLFLFFSAMNQMKINDSTPYSQDGVIVEQPSIRKKSLMLNSLPIEILIEIFCSIPCEELFGIKYVCLLWHKLIRELLDIQQAAIASDRETGATAIFDMLNNDTRDLASLRLYRAPHSLNNVINNSIMTTVAKMRVDVTPFYPGQNICYYFKIIVEGVFAEVGLKYTEQDILETVSKTVLSITGVEDPDEEIKNQGFEGEFSKMLMLKYTWYMFGTSFRVQDMGVIALYPDNQTFAVFMYPSLLDELSSLGSFELYD